MSEQVTIWKVHDDYGRSFSLRSVAATLTPAYATINRGEDSAPWRWSRRINRDRVHFTPAEALDAAEASYRLRIEQAEREVAYARRALDWIATERTELTQP